VKTWITVLCAVVLLFAGCAKEKKDAGVDAPKSVVEAPKVVVDWEKLEERDDLYYFKEKPFTGVAVSKYENGQKDMESTYKDGKLHGLQTEWHTNGQKMAELTFKNDKWWSALVWKPNGDKCPDTNLVDGNGIVCGYHDNGQKALEATYKAGEEIYFSKKLWLEDGEQFYPPKPPRSR
jgi:antitoxin component YwqK of YwqJK toxin-antitoxin module